MVKKEISGVSCEVRRVNPPFTKDGTAVYIYGERVAAYVHFARKVKPTAKVGTWGFRIKDEDRDAMLEIVRKFQKTRLELIDRLQVNFFPTRVATEAFIVDFWMKTNPKPKRIKPRSGRSCPFSGYS